MSGSGAAAPGRAGRTRTPFRGGAPLRGRFSFETFGGDVFGAVATVAVALPVAFGFGLASGLGPVAGLPGAGFTPFTVLNISAGGRTAPAGVLRAVLAGILAKIGWDAIDRRFLARLRHIDYGYRAAMPITLVLTVFVDLLTAAALGFIAAGLWRARVFE